MEHYVMFKIDAILKDKKTFNSLRSVQSHALINKKIRVSWGDIMGKLSQEIIFCYVKDATMMVAAKNPIWVTEIEFFKKEILKNIHAFTGYKKVTNIGFLHYQDEKNRKEAKEKKRSAVSFEQKIKNENSRKRQLNYVECSGCQTLWEQGKVCLFCSSTI
jgi:hypothetical protein